MRRLSAVALAAWVVLVPSVAPATHNTFDPDDFFERWDSSVAAGLNLKWR